MSFFRLFAPRQRAPGPTREDPTLSLNAEAFGCLFLTKINQPFGPQDPGYVTEPYTLQGWLQVSTPPGRGRCRCKSIKVGVRAVCRLAMGPWRGWEEDIVLNKEEKLEEVDGIWFEEGSTR